MSTPAEDIPALPQKPLRDCVRTALERYFRDLDGYEPGDLYRLVLEQVERPLLEVVMHHTGDNQTRAAAILGLNRTTLRKKLREHGLD
ncbi:MAG: Fis family transcriptional regulator [Chromatiales bacterium 21-64-14]|nr:MAG: Fis family transcriptional regulator [Chromatiales bacterium 21-64-14]HQU17222.1 DNA-binding transcriptional regulator Fis [Gammaproteobacteria bacterium]